MSRKSQVQDNIRITPTTAPTEDPALLERQRITDAAVRAARGSGYCDTFDEMLKRVMPDMIDPETGYATDSDGRSCHEDEWRDADGRDRHGFDYDGWDAEGYGRDGYHRYTQLNRDGLDRDGLAADDPARFGRDRHGETKDQALADEEERHAARVEQEERRHADTLAEIEGRPFIYDRHGYDREGWGYSGYHRDGRYSQEKDRYYLRDGSR